MNTNGDRRLLLKDEVYQIVGAAIEVLNGIGHALHVELSQDHEMPRWRAVEFQESKTRMGTARSLICVNSF